MRKTSVSVICGIVLAAAFQSCIFQTEPVRPNSPPYIKEASPEDLELDIEVPSDSILFSFTAGDADRDELVYSYVLLDDEGEVMEVLHDGPEFVFKPEEGTEGGRPYHLQGRVKDHSDFAMRDWYVHATELHNDPPVITDDHTPEQLVRTFQLGNEVEFRLGVDDDHPETLRFTFSIDGTPFAYMIRNNYARYRFMDNGVFDVRAVVWDGEYADTLSWEITVVGEPDDVPPARITDLIGWTGPEPGTVRLQWTAPGDDDMTGSANHYRVRTHTIPILNEDDWEEASQKNGVPVPGQAGTTEEMVVWNLNPGTWLFVTVRAVDDFGNISQLGNCIRLIARGIDADGYVTNAATGDPLEGVVVSSEGIADTTSADGYYKLANLPMYADIIRVRDESVPGDTGDYYDIEMPLSDIVWHFRKDLAMMPAFELVNEMSGTYEGNFYKFFRYITETRGLIGRPTDFWNWNHYPVTVYNPPLVWQDVDLQGLARTAMNVWNDLTGRELFVETSDPVSADVEIIYDTENYMKHHVETVSLNEDGTPARKEIWIYPINTSAPMTIDGRKIFAHELGHILQLGHSNDLGHLMVGATSPIIVDPSEDEVNLVSALVGLPKYFDATWYLEE
jgi:hypothetical protein